MKKIKGTHLIKMSKLLSKTNLKQDIKNSRKENKEDAFCLTIDLLFSVLEMLGDQGLEDELWELLSELFEADAKEMELEELIKNFKELSKENNLTGFFTQLTQ